VDGEIEPAQGDGVAAIETASGMAVAELRIRLSEPLTGIDEDDLIDGEVIESVDAQDELTVEDVLAAAPAASNPPEEFVPEFAPTVAATAPAEQLVGAVSAPAGPPRTINSAGSGSPLMHVTRLDQLAHVEMEVTVEIGRTRMTIGELLSLTPGQVIELDRAAGTPADLFVNGTLLARGEVVVVDEDFGLRVSEIVSNTEG
jgi:flagellar motor switch protein FliN